MPTMLSFVRGSMSFEVPALNCDFSDILLGRTFFGDLPQLTVVISSINLFVSIGYPSNESRLKKISSSPLSGLIFIGITARYIIWFAFDDTGSNSSKPMPYIIDLAIVS